jgi:hypothetical protein
MTKVVDKVVLTNVSALKQKYGAQGVRDIQSAAAALIQADKARGLQTQLIALDDGGAMSALSAPVVTNAGDPKQNKAAIDAVYNALAPDYLMILGSIDVIPHQELRNPLYDGSNGDDPDEFAYGDVPYACEAPYSQQPQDFVGLTRVVGRLPDITGANDASYFINLLEIAAGYKPVDHQAFMSYFAVTAQIWHASTQLSVTNTFGGAKDLQDVPPRNYKWKPLLLKRLAHFFNCHGADRSPQFYGQPASGQRVYPPALDATYINGKIRECTVAAAECCYGGQLYPLSEAVTQIGLCNAYLLNKCYAFFASTTIAYGPSKGNAQADLICQYFMRAVGSGASSGRAGLQARQQFVKAASPPDPSDIKTLAQFNLYGDPSLTPVAVAQADMPSVADKKNAKARFAAERAERKDRRRQLFQQGAHIAQTEIVPQRSRATVAAGVAKRMRARARDLGWQAGNMLSFTLHHPSQAKSALPKALAGDDGLPTAYHVLFEKRRQSKGKKAKAPASKVLAITALIGKEVNGELVSVAEIHSR